MDEEIGNGSNWDDAVNWADTLAFQGYDNWRLPSMSTFSGRPTGAADAIVSYDVASELGCRFSELGYMYYWNLTPAGDPAPTDIFTDLTGDQGLIQNISSVAYWSGTAALRMPSQAIGFAFQSGTIFTGDKSTLLAAWAVRPGDSAPVAEPTTLDIMGLALAGLGFQRRKTA